jgi:hypothetical protein
MTSISALHLKDFYVILMTHHPLVRYFQKVNVGDAYTNKLHQLNSYTSNIAQSIMASSTELRQRSSLSNSQKIAKGESNALIKVNGVPTEHGQEMDKKLDEHTS